MTWLKMDDHFPEHEKVTELHDRAFRLHVIAMCFCARNLTDGLLTKKQVRVCQAVLGSTASRWPADLVDAGLWIPAISDGYSIKDFVEYNPTAAQVKKGRKQNRDRQRRSRERNASDNGVSDGVTNGTPSRPVPSRSSYSPPTPSSKEERGGNIKSIEPLTRLLAVLPKDSSLKVLRTARKHKSSEGDYEYAIECCTGPGVIDPLAVALSTLKKRGESRNAA